VHGRTREQKDTAKWRADWDAIRAVKRAVAVPVIANGNMATLQDALE
jgi:tRNA-dihydrouridine synthase 1